MNDTRGPLDPTALRALARSNDPLLIVGGLEHVGDAMDVAYAIHQAGPRTRRPFCHLSCAELPADVLLSELFGHDLDPDAGLFRPKRGLFDTAAHGTICLLPLDRAPNMVQLALCQALERGLAANETGLHTRLIATASAPLDRSWHLSVRVVEPLRTRLTFVPLEAISLS